MYQHLVVGLAALPPKGMLPFGPPTQGHYYQDLLGSQDVAFRPTSPLYRHQMATLASSS